MVSIIGVVIHIVDFNVTFAKNSVVVFSIGHLHAQKTTVVFNLSVNEHAMTLIHLSVGA